MLMKGTLDIRWLSDRSDCETCGWSYADGAEVFLDGRPILLLAPVASCFGGSHWERDDVLKMVLEQLGYTVKEASGDDSN
jgi:hypothetical protein